MNIYQMGSNVRVRGEFRTPKTAIPANTLIDPSIVTLSIRFPDKTTEVRTYGIDDVDKSSTGIYTSVISLDQEGTYHWRWKGDNGAEVGVAAGSFDSRREPNF